MSVDAIVLNWNESHLMQHTVARLMPEVDQVIVVDNGSVDGSREWLSYANQRPEYKNKLVSVILSKNTGPSVARNIGLNLVKAPRTFLIDGDILYVPGTISAYNVVMDKLPNTGCVGNHDHHRVATTGMNGTTKVDEAATIMPESFELSNWFPMAWTQYGLFKTAVLRGCQFATDPPFDEPGHGYEDDWLYHDMQVLGVQSVAVNEPLYLHDGHYSLRLFQQAGQSSRTEDRAKVFYERWGKGNGWRESLASIPEEDRKPFMRVCPT